ncbi:MAG: hypothetical protein CSA32_01890 [Desulfobulbus propionicus]|nr:MAG: hypothetical protein CSA32_01890 [Desulfobulbus propionicus]
MRARRYWLERPFFFGGGKNEYGFGGYRARGWLARYHHVTMVMLFMPDQRYLLPGRPTPGDHDWPQ